MSDDDPAKEHLGDLGRRLCGQESEGSEFSGASGSEAGLLGRATLAELADRSMSIGTASFTATVASGGGRRL